MWSITGETNFNSFGSNKPLGLTHCYHNWPFTGLKWNRYRQSNIKLNIWRLRFIGMCSVGTLMIRLIWVFLCMVDNLLLFRWLDVGRKSGRNSTCHRKMGKQLLEPYVAFPWKPGMGKGEDKRGKSKIVGDEKFKYKEYGQHANVLATFGCHRLLDNVLKIS